MRGSSAVSEEFADQCDIHGAAGTRHGRFAIRGREVVLGRLRWARRQTALAILDQPRETKSGSTLHQRVRARTQEIKIAAEAKMLIEMSAQPGPAHPPVGPLGCADTFS